MERSVVTYGDTEIAYRIERSARRKTVAVSVAPGDGVVLTAPTAVPVSRLDRVVHSKAQWIVDRLRQVAEVEMVPAAAKEMVSGESFLYLGRHYRLKVDTPDSSIANDQNRVPPVRLVHGWLRVFVARGLEGEARSAAARTHLETWYRTRAKVKIPERVSCGPSAPDSSLARC